MLAPGLYLYCGSARGPGGLAARLARHMRREKRAHWHVDQLTCAGDVLGAWVFPGGDECAVNATLEKFPTPLEGFGSSDCRHCRSHLRFWASGLNLPMEFETVLQKHVDKPPCAAGGQAGPSAIIHMSPDSRHSNLEPGQLIDDHVPNDSIGKAVVLMP